MTLTGDEMKSAVWLADTSVFYKASSPRNISRIKITGARVVTSVSSIFEILSGMLKADEFQLRKNALRAIFEICGVEGIFLLEPDGKIAEAFGVRSEPLPRPNIEAALAIGMCAESPADITKIYRDKNMNTIIQLEPAALTGWDQKTGEEFQRQISENYRKPSPWLKGIANHLGYGGKEGTEFAKQAMAALIKSPAYRTSAFCGLAHRAGVIEANEIDAALADTSLIEMD